MSSPSPEVRTIDQREALLLAPYAMTTAESRGRVHVESPDSLRGEYARDRDRIVHSTAFRRLEYKTQVFVNDEGDHYRTRLTHTLEVAQISRTAARSLRLNEDLVEAIALSHDLGHPPFGHAGEAALDECMQGLGGFNHNLHALRVVDLVEDRYPEFSGLNLTWELREAIAQHFGDLTHPVVAAFRGVGTPLLEAQLGDLGDSLAYDCHDLDDGLRSGILDVAALDDLELWRRARERVVDRWPSISGRHLVSRTVSRAVSLLVEDLVRTTRERLVEHAITTTDGVRNAPLVVGLSDGVAGAKRELQHFLRDSLYRHPHCVRATETGKEYIHRLFDFFVGDPDRLPVRHRHRATEIGVEQAVCDYIAGMTDRFCAREYARLFPTTGRGGQTGQDGQP